MSNPTSNFGWQMPTATDLVTDLPADFEVFGQAVDTALMDLKGGTTGQVLKKNTNTDMDFVWAADAAGMTNPMTTTGDIIYSSSGSTPARLGIGTTGQVLNVTAGIPAWATPAPSGSLTLLSTTTLSGATVTIGSIDQTYKSLYLVIEGVTNATANGFFKMRVNNQDLSSTLLLISDGSTVTNRTDRQDSYRLTASAARASTYTDANNAWVVTINNYASSTNRKPIAHYGIYYDPSTLEGSVNGVGGYDANTAITSLVFSNSGGNLSTGTVKLYGVN
jgi:hypothetical protein